MFINIINSNLFVQNGAAVHSVQNHLNLQKSKAAT